MIVSAAAPSPDNAERVDELLAIRKALFIGAHPDDIEFYCGGLAHMLCARGAEVVFAVATRGGRGRTGRAKERLEALRTRHQLDAAGILGGARVVFFDYPDGALTEHISALARDLQSLIEREHQEMIFSWDPDHIYNPHPDHQAAAEASRTAAQTARTCHYGTREPDLWLPCDEAAFRIKTSALRAHRTETPWYFWPIPRRVLMKRSSGEGAKIGARYAETYRCVRQPA